MLLRVETRAMMIISNILRKRRLFAYADDAKRQRNNNTVNRRIPSTPLPTRTRRNALEEVIVALPLLCKRRPAARPARDTTTLQSRTATSSHRIEAADERTSGEDALMQFSEITVQVSEDTHASSGRPRRFAATNVCYAENGGETAELKE